ncbi:hypothetical protein DC083_03290 [Ignatzschineria ureiclastica]|uniref:ABC transporter permease n=1 Tax=Ignatzschineria ureiclastica TaxID=472582 RepID=A0A2U2AFP8_9GAMM|nr:hypothetical protein [Ignatzschineria ureiclastica]PWD81484.1 hypothetical protein DC083_03290 [Ignatzschineria ureiclastica]GHA01017.1 hypothetical protein GCM10007162_16650 [Ignatzschineria ureiclastica]
MHPFFDYWLEQEALLQRLVGEAISLLFGAFFVSLIAGSLLGLLLAGLRRGQSPLIRLISGILRFAVMLLGDYPFIILFMFIVILGYYGNMLPFDQMLQLLLMGWGALRFAYFMLQNLIDRAEEEGFAIQFIRSARQLAISLISAVVIAGIIGRMGIGRLLYEGFYQEDFMSFSTGALLFAILIVAVELIFGIVLFKARKSLRRQRQELREHLKQQFAKANTFETSDYAQAFDDELREEAEAVLAQAPEPIAEKANHHITTPTSTSAANSKGAQSPQSAKDDPFSGLIQ